MLPVCTAVLLIHGLFSSKSLALSPYTTHTHTHIHTHSWDCSSGVKIQVVSESPMTICPKMYCPLCCQKKKKGFRLWKTSQISAESDTQKKGICTCISSERTKTHKCGLLTVTKKPYTKLLQLDVPACICQGRASCLTVLAIWKDNYRKNPKESHRKHLFQ